MNDTADRFSPPEWWKKWRPLRWLAAIAVIATTAWWGRDTVASSKPHPETARYQAMATGVPLLDGWLSYSDAASVRAGLSQRGLTAREERLARPPSPRYPARELLTLSVENYAHGGVPGLLRLEFFNDRLFEAEFRPSDADAYARVLRRLEPQLRRDRNAKAESLLGERRVATNVYLAASDVGRSLRTRPFILWQDLRLIREREDWDAAYGSIPVPLD